MAHVVLNQFATGLATSSPQPGDNIHIPATTLTMLDFTNKRGENRSLGQSTTSNCNGGMIPEDGEREWMTLRRRGSKPGKTSLVQSSINFPLAKLNRHPGNSHLPQGPVGATDSWLQKGTLLHSGNSTSPTPVLVLAHRVAPRWVLGN